MKKLNSFNQLSIFLSAYGIEATKPRTGVDIVNVNEGCAHEKRQRSRKSFGNDDNAWRCVCYDEDASTNATNLIEDQTTRFQGDRVFCLYY